MDSSSSADASGAADTTLPTSHEPTRKLAQAMRAKAADPALSSSGSSSAADVTRRRISSPSPMPDAGSSSDDENAAGPTRTAGVLGKPDWRAALQAIDDQFNEDVDADVPPIAHPVPVVALPASDSIDEESVPVVRPRKRRLVVGSDDEDEDAAPLTTPALASNSDTIEDSSEPAVHATTGRAPVIHVHSTSSERKKREELSEDEDVKPSKPSKAKKVKGLTKAEQLEMHRETEAMKRGPSVALRSASDARRSGRLHRAAAAQDGAQRVGAAGQVQDRVEVRSIPLWSD